MNKLFGLFLLALACWAPDRALAQMSGGVGGFPGGGCGKGSCGVTCASSEGNAFLARLTGSPDNTHKSRYCTLIDGLVTDGIFTKLDVLYIFATDTAANALLNIKSSSFNATVSGTLTFTADVGYTGTGSPNYIDSGFNPIAAAGNYQQNSASMGAYVRTSRTGNASYASLGTQTGTTFSTIIPNGVFGNTVQYAANSTSPKSVAVTNAQGQWIASRTGASAIALQKNGAAFDSDTGTSGGRDNSNVFVFAANGGGATNYSQDQQSAILIGGGLTGTEMTNLAGRINTYMTAYGINVY